MSDRDYLKKFLANMIASGAVRQIPGEPIWLVAMTGWRESDPWQVGRWVGDQLSNEPVFAGLLAPYYDRGTGMTWARIDPDCLGVHAEDVFGPGVFMQVQDLFDVIDDHWRQMHAAPPTDLSPLVLAEAAGWAAYVAGRSAAPALDPVVCELIEGLEVGGGALPIMQAFSRGRDSAASAAALAATGVA